jgi:menaquinone reductase, iron-sulfur cluster-binding subunit
MKNPFSAKTQGQAAGEVLGGMDRMSFLKAMAALPFATMAAAAAGSEIKTDATGAQVNTKTGKKPKWGMAIDLDSCSGCGACVVACHVENNVPFCGDEPRLAGTEINWMTMLSMGEPGKDQLLPVPCMHCEDPPCVKVCPVNATFQSDEGIVDQVWDRCIGCRYCQNACPYSRRYFNWTEPLYPGTHQQALNPDVATRPEGVVEKCTFCVHRIRKLREESRLVEKEITDEDVRFLPACAQSCPAEAIVFGDLNDPDSLVSRLAESPRAMRLLEHVGTKPKVFFLGKKKDI